MLVRLILAALLFLAFTVTLNLAWLATFGATGKVLPSVTSALAGSPALLLDAIRFALSVIAAHIALAAAWAFIWRPLAKRMPIFGRQRGNIALLSFLPVLMWLLLTNMRMYPSSVATPDLSAAAAAAVDIAWWLLTLYGMIVLVASLLLCGRAIYADRRARLTVAAVAVLGVGSVAGAIVLSSAQSLPDKPRVQPDILLIGVDGLRTDHVGFLADSGVSMTPALDTFLADAAVISEAWTPLGRTFPAWVSILTGRYPSSHGAVFNLTRRDSVDDRNSLAHRLGELGYQRIYAIDETRFSNLDESFGFDMRISPGIGAFDFLAGAFADQPLINLIANTRAGEILFPYVHMNRALTATYDPAIFDQALHRGIAALDPNRPLFMAAHFELAHWPYEWADSDRFDPPSNPLLVRLSPAAYRKAVARVDTQIGALVAALDRAGRLDNAVVVLLSDHGEAFRGTEAVFHNGDRGGGPLSGYAGHGTHVMSEAQNRVMLAFRGFGAMKAGVRTARIAEVTASLVDVRSTLHEWTGIPLTDVVDGISLLPVLSNTHDSSQTPRAISIETGFSPESIARGSPDALEVVEQTAHYYEVGENGRLHLADRWLDVIRSTKQYASVSGPWVLGVLPEAAAPGGRVMLANFERGEYWRLGGTEATPGEAPLEALIRELCARYRRQIAGVALPCETK